MRQTSSVITRQNMSSCCHIHSDKMIITDVADAPDAPGIDTAAAAVAAFEAVTDDAVADTIDASFDAGYKCL